MTTPTHEKVFPSDERIKIPMPFIIRSLHSVLGVWLVVYLFEHLLVNSQSAFLREDDGYGFVSMVNKIHAIPYLKAVEVLFLGIPFLVHGGWGVYYAITSKLNARRTDGSQPSLPQYKRNHAFSWQRITSWILLLGIAAHVIHMRFVEYPTIIYRGLEKAYFVRVGYDAKLPHLAERIDVQLFDNQELMENRATLGLENSERKPLGRGEVLAMAPSAGVAFLLVVRDTFKSPLMVVLYSLLVVSAAYHAFNGLWTALITWGISLTRRSQKRLRTVTNVLMVVVAALGLLSAWGTYWVTRG